MRAVIVGSGPSARGFVPPDDVCVIAVNGAISWLPRADYWFSLDASERNKGFFADAVVTGVGCHVAGQAWADWVAGTCRHRLWKRIEGPQGAEYGHPLHSPEWWFARLQAVSGICKTPGAIHTGNSAWGALGVAYHLGFRDVALVGVDATQDDRVDGGTPGNLSHLPMLFASALPDMRVTSCGRLDSVPQMTFGEWYENR